MGDCDDYRRFDLAYDEGASFSNIPQDQARGGAITADVTRTCPRPDKPSKTMTATYSGIQSGLFHPTLLAADGQLLHVASVRADHGKKTTLLYLQNGGLECATASITYIPDAGGPSFSCCVLAVAPGETLPVSALGCAPPGFKGEAEIRSDQPLAVVADTRHKNSFESLAVVEADLGLTLAGVPDPVAAGADITYELLVTNASPSVARSVTVTLALPAGTTLVSAAGAGWSCTGSGMVTCSRPTLFTGESTIVVTATVAPGSLPGTVLSAAATVTASSADSNPADNSASDQALVGP
jgi:uncharacterized repeat protein (TIGR01451 family)